MSARISTRLGIENESFYIHAGRFNLSQRRSSQRDVYNRWRNFRSHQVRRADKFCCLARVVIFFFCFSKAKPVMYLRQWWLVIFLAKLESWTWTDWTSRWFGKKLVLEVRKILPFFFFALHNRRTADVRSVGYSELFSLSREDVLAAMKDYPEAQEILQTLGRKRLMEARNVTKGIFIDLLNEFCTDELLVFYGL